MSMKFSTSTGKSLNLKEVNEIFDEIRAQATNIIKKQLEKDNDEKVAKMFGINNAVVAEIKSGFPLTFIMTAMRIISEFDKINHKKKKG